MRFFILWGVFMASETIIYSADCYDKNNKPYCRYDLLWELSNEAAEFVENCLSLAERKKAIIIVYLSKTEIRTEMCFPHGIFLNSMNKMLAKLMLMSDDILFISGPAEKPIQIRMHINYILKSTE